MSTPAYRLVLARTGLACACLLPLLGLAADHQRSPEDVERMNADIQKLMQDPAFQKKMQEAVQRAQEKKARDVPAATRPIDAQGSPARDTSRVARIPPTPQTPSDLAALVKKVSAAVDRKVRASARGVADKMAQKVRSQLPKAAPGQALAVAANGAWVLGLPEAAVVLMGRAAAENPADLNTVNNFAAFLVMTGAEPQAIALLQAIKARSPGNATVLNNLGQAWYGLGEVKKAEDELDEAVRRFPAASQAWRTKADILEARGDKAGAAAAVARAAQTGVSNDKSQMAKRLGKPLDANAGPPLPKADLDGLGLDKFVLPAFCKGVADAPDCNARWNAFHKAVDERTDKITAQVSKLGEENQALSAQAHAQQVMEAGMLMANNPYARKAQAQMSDLDVRSLKKPIWPTTVWREREAVFDKAVADLQKPHHAAIKRINKQYEDEFGEGKSNDSSAMCAALRNADDSFMRAANPVAESYATEILQISKPYFNEALQLRRLLFDDRTYLREKLEIQKRFLGTLSMIHPVIDQTPGIDCPADPKPKPFKSTLPDFDELNCTQNISFAVPGVGNWSIKCNRAELNIDVNLDVATIGYSRVEDLRNNRVVRSTASISNGVGDVKLGPLSAGVDVGAYVEFGDGHLTGFGVTAGAGSSVATGLPDRSISTTGANVTVGWSASNDVEVKGVLSGLMTD